MHVSTRAALLAATLVWATSASAQTYTLEEAVRTAVANSPQGEATAARLDGLNAARSAADTNPAPTIDGTVENIGTPGFSQWQIDGTYNQRLERGGKRAARVGLAQGDIAVAEAEALVRRLDLASEVQALYVEAPPCRSNLPGAGSRSPRPSPMRCSAGSMRRATLCSPERGPAHNWPKPGWILGWRNTPSKPLWRAWRSLPAEIHAASGS